MSDGVHASPGARHRGPRIVNPRDFYGGLGLVLLGLLALWASRDLPGIQGFAFGPGTAPRMFALILIALGAAVMAVGYCSEGAALERYEILSPTLIILSYMFAVANPTTATWIVAAGLLLQIDDAWLVRL